MKHIIFSIALLFSSLICNAQIAAPNQTDTLVITSVKYNYADINRENWPCEIIYKSMKDIRIGEQTFNIVNADKFMGTVTFTVYDNNDSSKKGYKLTIDEDTNGEYTLVFSGYEFTCHKKTFEKEEVSSKENYSYRGPSIKSYEVNGRKASHLPIPAYRCYSEGEVTVIISVSPAGQIVKADIKEDVSATDECLRSYALRAAKTSRFAAKHNATSNELGEIVYSFGGNSNEQHNAAPNAKLAGRSVNGTLPIPSYGVQADGKVVVKIWVDQYGNVTKAQAGAEGTTATDKTLWQAAYKAAMGAHFNMDASAPTLQEGTITYIFRM